MIRPFKEQDIEASKIIHHKFFQNEFEYPNFERNFICSYTCQDEDSDRIIAVGGVRSLAECVMVTNKEFPVKDRRKAFHEILAASIYFAEKSGHDSLHAFIINNPEWEHHLRRAGFKYCKGNAIYLPIGEI